MRTSSLSWPNMFDVARNQVAVVTDRESVTNRVKLMMLTEPTELYNEPTYGVGLSQHLFKYNTENEYAVIQDKIIQQLRLFEPSSVPEETKFADGLLFTESNSNSATAIAGNELKFTVAVQTTFGETANTEVEIDGYER